MILTAKILPLPIPYLTLSFSPIQVTGARVITAVTASLWSPRLLSLAMVWVALTVVHPPDSHNTHRARTLAGDLPGLYTGAGGFLDP